MEELIKKLDEAIKMIEELRSENALLLLKLTETEEKLKIAEEKLNQNSNNSHLPPSKDIKKPIKSGLPKSKKKNGGQEGHKGDTLKMVDNPDKIIQIRPNFCTCGEDLSHIEGEISGKRQVFDIPVQKFDVTEYQTIKVKCSCGKCTVGKFPANVTAPVQYGSGVQAATLLFSTIGTPINKIGFIFQCFFGQKINDSTILKLTQSKAMTLAYDNIYKNLVNELVLCVDESGFHVILEKMWCHVISTLNLTYLYASPKRGQIAFEQVPMLKEFDGWVIHDSYSSYNNLNKAKHGLCNAHICRELIALIENNESKWAQEMLKFLHELFKETDKGTEVYIDFVELETKYEKIIQTAEKEEPIKVKITGKRGKNKGTKGRNLLDRMIKFKNAILAFAKHDIVPFTNNLAERDFRQLKVKNKIAGYLKSPESLQTFLVNLSIFKTLVKNKINPFLQIRDMINFYPLILT